MPPKKQPQKEGGGKKPSATKIVEDRTFGMKNKKGAQMQRQIAQMTQSAKAGGTPEEKKKAAEKAQREKEKVASEAAAKEAAELFKPVQVQKVPFGVDPKTVLCQFYKKGHCEKGRKCKFSHDLNIERKAQKKDLYQDTREEEEETKKKETSDDWDEEKLRSVVLSKKGNQKTTTDKVCKFFIDAVEEGNTRFILKTKEQRAAEKALLDKSPLKTLTLEDFLESERHKLTGTLTPVTPETFAKWKAERMDKKQAEQQAQAAKEATGRALFEKGDWNASGDEDEDDDGDESDDDLEKLRQETEALRAKKEAERLAGYGHAYTTNGDNGVLGSVEPDIHGADDESGPS
ncbi:putative Translation machinery-associated protein 46 [Glarea lozoyensis 74030]|uniref:Putative Translation machinery-associated protein 46 n=1 Tax=Glarea lozoyensis (strain ATCC 74030 / MF5533) TaxID=1104152 RepID=H0EUT9_GLAL7|nr:putative Translation machinery-associated protein 46 [Glarea lozoyensis 74030]